MSKGLFNYGNPEKIREKLVCYYKSLFVSTHLRTRHQYYSELQNISETKFSIYVL